MLGKLIRRGRLLTTWISAVVAVVLIVTAFAGLLPQGTLQAEAAVTQGTSGHIADADTTTKWVDVLDADNNSTRYSGRVWTDKTVSTENMTFTGDVTNEGSTTIENNSDFLVTYSALAMSQEIIGWPPTDTVFVLDFSASMCWNNWDENGGNVGDADGSDSRIKYMVDALNNAIDTLVKASPFNRIAIVTFNASADTLLPLTGNIEVRSDKAYLELNGFTGTTGLDDGVATVRCNINGQSDVTASVTNIQAGLYQGMDILVNADTTATFGGETVTRIPNVVLMSDGAPTTFAPAASGGGYVRPGVDDQRIDSGQWWNGVKNEAIGYGDNSNPHSGNGFMTLLTASYMKNAITSHYYGGLNTGRETNIYTIGFGIGEQTDGMVEMSNLVLNPADNMEGNTNEQVQNVIDAWNTYQSQSGSVEVEGLTPSTDGYRPPFTYRVERASTSLDPTTLAYPTEYFPAEDSDALNDAFTQIANMITEQAKVPTHVWGDETQSGYITYTDPIGEYMEVKDVKTILLGGQRFDRIGEPSTSGNVTTYSFSGEVDSPVYGTHDVSEIHITVTTDNNGMQTLKAEIPASVIPVRVNTIEREANGTIQNTNNQVYPIRILYEVGVKAGVITDSGTLNTDTSTGGVSQKYIDNNGDGQGGVYFYSNLYRGSTQGDGDTAQTVGDAYSEFTPARDNPFYFVQDSIQLYTDENCESPATFYDRDATYYFQISYYDSDSHETAVVSRSADLMDGYTYSYNGALYLRAGAPRLGNLLDVVDVIKDNNTTTNTADTLIYPTFEGEPDSGYFKIYHGNNGRLTVANSVSLSVTKRVETFPSEGVEAPDAEFTFEAVISSMAEKNNVAVTVTNSDGTEVNPAPVLNFDRDGKATFTLKAGQTLTIPGLKSGNSYSVREVTENLPEGFSLKSGTGAEQSGTLGSKNAVIFTNVYTVGSITITKRDGAGDLLEGARFAVYKDGEAVNVDINGNASGENRDYTALPVYLAQKVEITPSDVNYDTVNNRYKYNDTSYIVHQTTNDGEKSIFYYKKLSNEEIELYRAGIFNGEVEAIVEFTNLPLGTYKVKEEKEPDGYIAAEDFDVVMTESSQDYYDFLYTVENHRKLVLPTTGLNGIGFIVAAGVILAAGGGGYFFFRRLVPAGSRRRRHHR